MVDGVPSTGAAGDVLVAMCDRSHVGDPELSPAAAGLLVGQLGDVQPAVVPDLCSNVASLPDLLDGTSAGRVVLALCDAGPSRAELQLWGRKAELDPFAVETVDLGLLGRLCPTDRLVEHAAAALAGAVTAGRAAGSTPIDRMRMQLAGDGVSRRALLSGAPMTYRPVAAIDRSACLGTKRCGLCADACPVEAILRSDPIPSAATGTCVGCAACVTSCPTGAAGVASATIDELEARMDALRAWPWSEGPPGILFACRGALRNLPTEGAPAAGAGWMPFPVPCLSSVTEGWLLQALAGGAPAVGVLGCGDGCGAGSRERTDDRLAYSRALLTGLGWVDAEQAVRSVRVDKPGPLAPLAAPLPATARVHGPMPSLLAEPMATRAALSALVDASAVPEVAVGLGPLGDVAIAAEGCTLCGICAKACPTAALMPDEGAESAALSLDTGRCVACEHCVRGCPEQVVTVVRRTGPSALAGRRTVKVAAVGQCRRCGRPVAPTPMLDRIREMLPDEAPELLDVLTGLCLECRGR